MQRAIFVINGFPAIGKSYLGNQISKLNHVVDLDALTQPVLATQTADTLDEFRTKIIGEIQTRLLDVLLGHNGHVLVFVGISRLWWDAAHSEDIFEQFPAAITRLWLSPNPLLSAEDELREAVRRAAHDCNSTLNARERQRRIANGAPALPHLERQVCDEFTADHVTPALRAMDRAHVMTAEQIHHLIGAPTEADSISANVVPHD